MKVHSRHPAFSIEGNLGLLSLWLSQRTLRRMNALACSNLDGIVQKRSLDNDDE
jgi:hypothetical protein